MLKKFWNFITGKTKKENDKMWNMMFDTIETLKFQNNDLAKLNETITSQLQTLQQQINKREEKYNGKEPYIEIISDGFDPDKGIKMNLDWNAAFIEHAKENGLQGLTDYEIVRKYLAYMYLNIIEQMDETDSQQ